MKIFKHKIIFFIAVIIALQFSACKKSTSSYEKIEPAHTEHIEGSELSKLTLTEKAAERIGIQTAKVIEESIGGEEGYGEQKTQKVTPFASILYDSNGKTWVFTNPEPLIFIRHEIKIDRIEGDKVYLLEGPPVGTTVATRGVIELYGTETHVGH